MKYHQDDGALNSYLPIPGKIDEPGKGNDGDPRRIIERCSTDLTDSRRFVLMTVMVILLFC